MAHGQWVTDVTEETFADAVVERSRTVPVVVDFWAPWCAPCRQLGPLLEALAEELNGGFVLAKVNTDENPELAGQFGVNGIPAVYAVRDAKVIDQFVGLLPEDELRSFVSRLAPTAAETGTAKAQQLEASDPAAAEAAYREVLAGDAAHEAGRVGLARVLLAGLGREAEAFELLRGIDVGEHTQEADRLRKVIQLREVPHADGDLAAARKAVTADPESPEARYRLGSVLAARGEYVPALDELLAAAERDKKLAQSFVRERMVTIFHVIGVRSPDADAYRDKLRSLLY